MVFDSLAISISDFGQGILNFLSLLILIIMAVVYWAITYYLFKLYFALARYIYNGYKFLAPFFDDNEEKSFYKKYKNLADKVSN